jgi:hypothetical protein
VHAEEIVEDANLLSLFLPSYPPLHLLIQGLSRRFKGFDENDKETKTKMMAVRVTQLYVNVLAQLIADGKTR